MATDAIPVLTIESIPIARVIGGVSAIARHSDAAQAEAAALAQLQASAAAAGADAVIGWRTAIAHEIAIESESPALSPQVMVRSIGGFVVHVSGTAVVRR